MPTNPIVILTRDPYDNAPLLKRLGELDIEAIEYPCIKTHLLPYGESSHLEEGKKLKDFQAVVFTSKRGVAGMTSAYKELSKSGQLIAVVGENTADAVRRLIGREPAIIADPPNAENLAHRLVPVLDPSKPVLHVRGDKSTGSLDAILTANGFPLTELVVYKNPPPLLEPLDPELMKRGIIFFASPSAARYFFRYNPVPPTQLVYLALGPTTAGYLRGQVVTRVFQLETLGVGGVTKKLQEIIQGGMFDEE